MVRRGRGQWGSCPAEPTHAGYRTITRHMPPDRRGSYRLFVCPAHVGLVEGGAPMADRDRAELARRRAQEARALQGLPYERVGPVGQARK